MARFPVQLARQELGVIPTTAVRARIDTRTGAGAVGVVIGQGALAVVGALQKRSARRTAIEEKNRANRDVLSSKQADKRRELTEVEINKMKLGTVPEKWEEETLRIVSEANAEIAGFDFSPEAMAMQQILIDSDLKTLPAREFVNSSRVISKATIKIAEEGLTDDYRVGREDIAQRKLDFIAVMKNNGVSAIDIILKLRAAEEAGIKLRKADAIENIKPALIEAIDSADKEEAIKTLNLATKILTETGVLSEAEAADANKVLGDWIDNFVAGRFKRAKDTETLATRQAYVELSEAIVGGNLTFDGIDESALLKADKDKWKEYIKGSYQDAPTENTPKGHDTSFNAVYDAATLQLSPTEAYDVLLEARFTDRTITDGQFKWALDKIENPYPEHLLEDINAVTRSNLEDFNRIFKADKDRNKRVNESLLAWIDKLIEQDKVPLFDFKKKMNAMSSQFRVGNARWYDIGQVIQRGGRNWEVVGFDENGEPLVDEVK